MPDCHAPGWGPDENPFLSDISLSYNERAADTRHLAEGKSDVWKWTLSPSGPSRVLQMKEQGSGQQARVIASFWEPFSFPWEQWPWWLETVIFLTLLYFRARSEPQPDFPSQSRCASPGKGFRLLGTAPLP